MSLLAAYNVLKEEQISLENQIACVESSMKCFGCNQFDRESGYCKQWSAVVPADGQREGCNKFDDVPF